jgi:hypothetical protein
MKFKYNSLYNGQEKELAAWRVEELRQFLLTKDLKTFGNVNDALFEFQDSKGKKLLIHHMQPIFVYLCWSGRVWDK